MFDLKRPCVDCPFRKQQGRYFRLMPRRLAEIRKASSFQCHKTLEWDEDGNGQPGNKPQQCAGLIALNEKDGQRHTQIVQVAQRLIGYDPTTVEGSDVFDTWDDCITAHNPPDHRPRVKS